MSGWFHYMNGLYFRREEDGAVRIVSAHSDPNAFGPIEPYAIDLRIDRDSWESVLQHLGDWSGK